MKKPFSRPLAALAALILSLSLFTACAMQSDSKVQTTPQSTVATSAPVDSDIGETTIPRPEITSVTQSAVTTSPETASAETSQAAATTQATSTTAGKATTSSETQAATTAAPVTTAATTTIKIDPASGRMYAKSSVNVRSGPGTEFKRVGHLDAGDEVELTGLSENGWYRIKFKGSEYFVSGKYLVSEKPAVTTAVTTSATTAEAEKKEYSTAFIRDNGMEFVWKSMDDTDIKENVAAVMNGMQTCAENISLPHPVAEDDIRGFVSFVFDYTCGYSHIDWYDYGYWYDGSSIVNAIKLTYTDTAEDAEKKLNAVNKRVDEIVAAAPTDSEYERVKFLHDMLVNNCSFDFTLKKEDSYNAYGALIKGEAVCHGYSNALQLLLSRAGFDAVTIIGEVEGGFHKWNYVKLSDGEWYAIDPTWDDTTSDSVIYDYFLVSDKTMKDKGHIAQYGALYFTMPSADNDYKAK